MLVKFGEFVLKSRQNSVLFALLFGFVPFFSWVSNLIVGLVTLRKGSKEGAWVLLWATIPDIAFLMLGDPGSSPVTLYLYAFFGSSLYVWLMALVLRNWVSWSRVLEANIVLGVVTILVAHIAMPDIVAHWYDVYNKAITDLSNNTEVSSKVFGLNSPVERENFFKLMKDSQFLQYLAKLTTGLLLCLLMVSGLIKLALARWWQALLFNPGGLRSELHGIRLSFVTTIIFFACWLAIFANITLAWDFLPVFFIIFLLAGLSLLHWQAARMKNGGVFLIIFYLIVVVFSGYVLDYALVGLIVTAIVDSCIDLRRRVEFRQS